MARWSATSRLLGGYVVGGEMTSTSIDCHLLVYDKNGKKMSCKGLMTTISFSLQRAHSARYGNCPCD